MPVLLVKFNLETALSISWHKIQAFSTQFGTVQLLSHVQLFATPWITARQASLSITNSWSLLKLMPIESVMPSSHLILCLPLLLLPSIPPSIRSFPMSQLFAWGGQSIGVSASASVLPMNTQDWSPLGWTGWISLRSKGLSRVFSISCTQNRTVLEVAASCSLTWAHSWEAAHRVTGTGVWTGHSVLVITAWNWATAWLG